MKNIFGRLGSGCFTKVLLKYNGAIYTPHPVKVYRGYIVFAFSVIMFVCQSVI